MIQVKKIYFYLSLLISLIVNELQAQSINRVLNDVAMPSANATAFGKYGDIPVQCTEYHSLVDYKWCDALTRRKLYEKRSFE